MREVRLQWLRPAEVLAERARCPIAYLPIGPLEWHGPHLPLGTDPLHAEHLAVALASEVGGVVYPTLYWGTERERSPELLRDLGFTGDEWIVGMDFPANSLPSFYAPEEQFAAVVRWTVDGMIAHGFRLIVLTNGHGAKNQLYHLARLTAELNARGPARLLTVYLLAREAGDDPGHATITETAAVMALDPGRVDLAALPAPGVPLRNIDWAIVDGETFEGHPTAGYTVHPADDPRRATPDLGRQHLAATIACLVPEIRQAYAAISGSGGPS
jgi:creatinine amidohydrolase